MKNVLYIAIISVIMFNAVHASTLLVSVTAQRPTMDVGQNSIITASVQGGNGAYTCLWSYQSFYNPSTPIYLGNESCTAKFYANSSTFANSPDGISVAVNDIAGDTGTGSTLISLYYQLVLHLIPSATTIDSGGSVSFTNNTANGSITLTGLPPYSFDYTNIPNNVIESGNGFTFTEPGTYVISETVTDTNGAHATANATINVLPTTSSSSTSTSTTSSSTTTSTSSTTSSSSTSTSTISSSTTIPQLSFAINSYQKDVYVGGNVIITNTTSGGIPPYSYSYSIPQNAIYTGNNIFTFTEPGTYEISETATDSASNTATSNAIIMVTEQQQQGCTGGSPINITVTNNDYMKYEFIHYSGSGINLNINKKTMWPVSININGAKSCLYVNSSGGALSISSQGSFDTIIANEIGNGLIYVDSNGSHNILKTNTQGYQYLSLHGSMDNLTSINTGNTTILSFGSLNNLNITSQNKLQINSFGSNENVDTYDGNIIETYIGRNNNIFAFGGTINNIFCFGNKDNLTATGTIVINNNCGINKGVDGNSWKV